MGLRVLLASPFSSRGGITKWAQHVLHYYHDNSVAGLEIKLLPMDRFFFTNLFTRLVYGVWEYSKIIIDEWSKLRHQHYDVFHLCTCAGLGLMKDWVMLKLAKLFHVRTVLHFHFGRIPSIVQQNGWEWWLLRNVMRYVDVAVAIDQGSFQTLASMGYDRVVYIPNPIAPAVTAYVNKNKDFIRRDERMILFVGNCLRYKGIYELVEACKGIPNIHLVLLGGIEEKVKGELYNMVDGADWLRFLGQRSYEEVLMMMQKCDVFVLPSHTEGFPNVILESMASGCAIVATEVGAIPEMLKDEDGQKCGLTIAPKNVQALKDAINYFFDNPDFKQECSRRAKMRVNKMYNMQNIWSQLVQVWHLANEAE